MTTPRFNFLSTTLPGLTIIQRTPLDDDRGTFCRLFSSEEFKKNGFQKPIAQINHTYTQKKGVVRGLHFQGPPHSDSKIVSCIKGEVLDVVVDIRKGSPTFLRWHAKSLSAANQLGLLIPDGFAHGFQSLTDECELIYFHSELFYPEDEGGLNVSDPKLGIKWPLPISNLSNRDRSHPFISSDFVGIQGL